MIAISSSDLVLFFASQFYQGLLKKLDIGLQVSGTTLHPRFRPCRGHPANVLCGYRRRLCDERCSRSAAALERADHHRKTRAVNF